MQTPQEIEKLNTRLKSLPLADRLSLIAQSLPNTAQPTTFGTEDQLITWAIVKNSSNVAISTPLTEALLDDARTLLEITNERYDINIKEALPDEEAIWIIGKSQNLPNADRSKPIVHWDTSRAMLQVNPLADWSFQEVLHAIAEHEVPINPLLDGATTQHSKTRPHFDALRAKRHDSPRIQAKRR